MRGGEMTIHKKASRVWDERLKVGESLSCLDLFVEATGNFREQITPKERSIVSAFLSNKVKAGRATKEKKGRHLQYTKTETDTKTTRSRGPQLKPEDNGLDYLQVGRSIVTVIAKLKERNKLLETNVTYLKREIRDVVEAKQKIERLYTKAQERILALNQGSLKKINLAELQALVRG
jgi:hypothetical protein